MDEKRVVVTGMGVVSPLGSDLAVFWDGLKSGRSGVRRITKFDVANYDSQIAGEVTGFDLDAFVPKKEQRRMDEYSHYAMGAAKMAVADSGLNLSAEDVTRFGVIVGSGIGGLQTLEAQHAILMQKGPSRCSPFMIPQMISNMAAGLIGIEFGLKGPNYAIVTACATAAHSIGDAYRIIQRGDADVMLAGGAEATICPLGLAGFAAMRALSVRNDEPTRASRPFDANRSGFVIAEGGAIIVLEDETRARKRGARLL